MDFTVNGAARPIRRSAKQGSQKYSVDLGREPVDAGQSVAVAYTYRTVTNVDGHVLQVRMDQPSDGLAVTLDYGDTDISSVLALDFIAGARPARISRTPDSVPGRSVSIEFDGWVFARSGVAFVWTGPDTAISEVARGS